jgi:hypothetical protein
MFQCPTARCVWGAVGSVLGTNTCPNNLWQALTWFYAFVPGGSEGYGGYLCDLLGNLENSEQSNL